MRHPTGALNFLRRVHVFKTTLTLKGEGCHRNSAYTYSKYSCLLTPAIASSLLGVACCLLLAASTSCVGDVAVWW